MEMLTSLKKKFNAIWDLLDERGRRILAANEAMSLGYGGVSMVHRACGISRKAIANGIREIQQGIVAPAGRIRKSGGGRKPLTSTDPTLTESLEKLIEGWHSW